MKKKKKIEKIDIGGMLFRLWRVNNPDIFLGGEIQSIEKKINEIIDYLNAKCPKK